MRYYDPQQSIAELRAITFVQAQLGEPLREDGPILGMEFDPLPPDAFGAPIAQPGPGKQPGWPFEAKLYERCDASCQDSNVKTVPLGTASPFVRLNEHVPPGLCLQSQVPTLNLMAQDGRPGHLLHKTVGDYENVLPKTHSQMLLHAKFGTQPIIDNPLLQLTGKSPMMRIIIFVQFSAGEEARIAREVEAHEKRIRKELEKQDNLRLKVWFIVIVLLAFPLYCFFREEQIRKEMERHDRERRKEEERFLREKQRRWKDINERKGVNWSEGEAEKLKQKEEQREKRGSETKAANERAIARKIAKESTELVEDERLELMELATLSKGLPSVLSLDFETLQNLDLYRAEYVPPKSVLLSRPLLIQPWSDSEENVANLLMVLMTFADVLGIWPFTLDEFVQAFHDYDTRLLGELHIALLRSIIKDIEDVARTPASGLGTNQNTAVNPGGGHPHIVAGAYAWGFDIRNWQQHLNPLTWPEILRQFALSAGLGPQLKKRNIEQAHHDNEGNDGEDVINNLRMELQLKMLLLKCKKRGSNGLTILEVVDKIQRSGLRDLTTSKTPEASVAAALSRDTKLFERTAPSTYCVRPAYRKDPTDADAILAAARERIRVFTGFADGEDAEDAERDDDSESDGPDDPEVDDLVTELKPKEEAYPEGNEFNSEAAFRIRKQINEVLRTPNGVDDNEKVHAEGLNGAKDVDTSSDQSVGSLNALVALIGVAIEGNSIRIVLEQMWAEAQLDKRRMKEEYIVKMHYPPFCKESSFMNDDEKSSELPLNIVQQEQLSALQGINNHLNNIPSERNVEIQDSSACLDNLSNQQLGQVAERSRSTEILHCSKAEEMYAYRSLPLGLDRGRNRYWQFTTSSSHNDPGSGRIFVELHDGRWRLVETEEGFDSLLASLDIRGIRESYLHMMLQKIEVPFKKVVRRNTQQTYMEKQSGDPVQAEAVGITSDADISANIDIPSNSTWVADLDMNAPSTSFRIEIGRTEAEKNHIFKRYQDFEKWMWKECANHLVLRSMKCGNKRCEQILNVCDYCHDIVFYEDNQCPSCHKTYEASGSNLNFCNHEDKHIMDRDSSLYASASPLGIRLLKMLLALIEVSIPSEALLPLWTNDYRKSWGLKLWYSASAKDLLQILTLLEIA
ncbi:hypothetical protein K2173_014334 [Erythroxylum novogranatense]|uniref:DDT domain-containing protein n=1 Tax=Erythroxylum novogranatense TaxID=1862640 RepID=A0AAV8S616_9ROSI|nr:hypothetical protein K2173_014334 [Erythroxylum novogranatense]